MMNTVSITVNLTPTIVQYYTYPRISHLMLSLTSLTNLMRTKCEACIIRTYVRDVCFLLVNSFFSLVLSLAKVLFVCVQFMRCEARRRQHTNRGDTCKNMNKKPETEKSMAISNTLCFLIVESCVCVIGENVFCIFFKSK